VCCFAGSPKTNAAGNNRSTDGVSDKPAEMLLMNALGLAKADQNAVDKNSNDIFL